MERFSSMRRVPIVIALTAVALALMVALPRTAVAQEVVTITDVTFERFGGISDVGTPTIAVRITCDGTGIIGDLAVELEQRGAFGTTNSDLLDAACTTTPTRYILQFDVFDGAFRPGRVTIRSAETLPEPGVEWADGQLLILRKGSLLG